MKALLLCVHCVWLLSLAEGAEEKSINGPVAQAGALSKAEQGLSQEITELREMNQSMRIALDFFDLAERIKAASKDPASDGLAEKEHLVREAFRAFSRYKKAYGDTEKKHPSLKWRAYFLSEHGPTHTLLRALDAEGIRRLAKAEWKKNKEKFHSFAEDGDLPCMPWSGPPPWHEKP